MTRYLITGGAGFIGSHLVKYLLSTYEDCEVTVLDALTYAGNLENLASVEHDSRYRFVKGDICDREIVFSLVQTVDVVVHCAAQTHVDRSIMDPGIFLKTNVLGTQVLLDVCKEYDIRFHHMSTDEVFGTLAPEDSPFTESTPYAPRSPYAASKASSDHLVRAYHITYGLRATISNCSNNYGTHMFPEKIIPLFISNLLEDKKVPVYGDGQQMRDWIHVSDHCRGIDMVLQKGEIGETYLFGGDGEITNLMLTKKLVRLCARDESSITHVTDRAGHDRRYAIDYTKAKQELGWTPQVLLDEGLQEMVRWYRENQAWVARCKNGEYLKYYEQQYSR